MPSPRVLLVSKPLVPPWNDSGKNLARDLARAGSRYKYHVLATKAALPAAPLAVPEPVYTRDGGFSPGLAEKGRVFARLLFGKKVELYHYFFAPNPLTSAAARLAGALRGVPSIQTVSSAPKDGVSAAPWIFGRCAVALSRATRDRLLNDGVPPSRLALIPPGIEPLERPAPARIEATRARLQAGASPLVVFPGDYEVSKAAETFAEAALLLAASPARPLLVFACRAKTARAQDEQARLSRVVAPAGDRVRFLGEVDDMPALLAAAEVVTLPAESLYAKMDAPLVLLEALSLGVPVVVADTPPLSEMLERPLGLGVPPKDPAALAGAIEKLLSDRDLYARLSEGGRAAVRDVYSAKAMAARYEALYDEVLAEFARG